MGRSLGESTVVLGSTNRNRRWIGSTQRSAWYDSSEMSNLSGLNRYPKRKESHSIIVDDYGTVWAAGNCSIIFKPMGEDVWNEYNYCQAASNIETPSDMMIIADSVYLATTNTGVHILDYTTSSSSGSVSVTVDSQTDWSTQNFLSLQTRLPILRL